MGPTTSLMILTALGFWVCQTPVVHADPVTILATPEGGIQPQAAIDERGIIHLVFFKGDPAGGDLFYARVEPGGERFTPPVRVNSQPGSAIAIGTIHGGPLVVILIIIEYEAERSGRIGRSLGRTRSFEQESVLLSPRGGRSTCGDAKP